LQHHVLNKSTEIGEAIVCLISTLEQIFAYLDFNRAYDVFQKRIFFGVVQQVHGGRQAPAHDLELLADFVGTPFLACDLGVYYRFSDWFRQGVLG